MLIDDDMPLEEILKIADQEYTNPVVKKSFKKPCPKCHGTKIVPKYAHYKHGKCFECNGRGYVYK